MILSNAKRLAASITELAKGMTILNERINQLRNSQNAAVEAINKLGERFSLEWDEKTQEWINKPILVPYDPKEREDQSLRTD